MATYHGHVHTREDAILLFEACQLNILPKIQRRLSLKERTFLISPGAVFIWDEAEAGIQRWTDGRLWGTIAFSESFIIRREMERTINLARSGEEREAMAIEDDGESSQPGSDGDGGPQMDEGTIDVYQYKTGGLTRRSMTISASGRQLHLVTYHDSTGGYTAELPIPRTDSRLKYLIEETIGERPSVPFPRFSNEFEYLIEKERGSSNMRPPPFMGSHIHEASPPPRGLHHPVDRSQLGSPYPFNDNAMDLYMVLASYSQNLTHLLQHDLRHPYYPRLQPSAISAPSLQFGEPLQHTHSIPMIRTPPSPPRSPSRFVAPFSPTPGTIPTIPPVQISAARSFCSPLPKIQTRREALEPSAQQASFGERQKSGRAQLRDRREGNISHQSVKVSRDDEKAVRALDRRFLIR